MSHNLNRLLILLLMVFIAAGCVKVAKKSEPITVTATLGTVSLNQPGRELRPNAVVQIGDRIITGENSMATLQMPDKSLIRIFEKSDFTIISLNPAGDGKEAETTLGLDKGRSMLIIQKLAKGGRLSVKTPTSVAAVRGTSFTVAVRESSDKENCGVTDVKVLDGTVYVEAKDKPEVNTLVNKGEMIALSNDAVVEEKKPIPEKAMKELVEEETDLGKAVTADSEPEVKKDDAQPKAGAMPPVLKTEAAIKQYYHKLEEVSLDDGSVLVGAVIYQNASFARIHTSSGIIQVPTSSIKTIRMR